MPDMLSRPFEVVVDFDDARLQQQVQELQVLQQQEFRNPLPQRYQPMLPFAQQTAAVSERLSWHFRCPASPLLRHAPETLFERRQSRTSSDGSQPDTGPQPLKSTGGKKDNSEKSAGSSQRSDVPDVTVVGAERLQQDDGRPRSASNRGKRNRLRRPGREFLLPQGHGRRSPAELRHRVSAPGTVRDAARKTSSIQQHSKSDSTVEKQEQSSSASGTGLYEKDMPAVYCKSVKLMAGPSAAELTQQLGILLGILRDLAESPAFQDLQVEKQSSPPPSACPSSPGETSADSILEPSLRRQVDDPARAAAQAANAATAAAKAAAIAAAKAAATATEAATRGTGDSFGSFSSSSSPTGDFTSPVEAVLAATAAARAAATAAASAANAFAVTAQAGGKGGAKSPSVPLRGPGCVVDAGVGTDMIPLPPEAHQQREQELKWIELEEAVDLARRAQLRQCFRRWRRASLYDNVMAELTQKTAERKEVSLVAEKKQGTTKERTEKKTTVAQREAEETHKEKAHQSGQRHRRPQSARFSDEKSWKDQDWEERGDRERQTINACLESEFDFHDKDDDPDYDEADVSDALYNQILQEERCLRKQQLRRRNSKGKKRGGSGV
ncbi:hypothetical protein CSUI_003820 [Cystoisospora suis]|uniref:Uncharacterized protein n=1 Tax=Cystoisospora suis TaxID=483139 RepID=A0A2C6L3H4_9APIC|nr:hypothetical protein CSUI_003820 [Cystoisospora suis]